MTSRTLLLIRHGESTANVAAREAERAGADIVPVEARDADVPLSPLGERQAAALGDRLAGALAPGALVYCSPYLRARQTASIALGDPPMAIDERLRDRELGILDRLTTTGVEHRYPEEAERKRWVGKFYHRPPGGESWADVALRLRSFLQDLPPGEAPVLVFAHDAVVSLFVYVLLRMTEAQLTEYVLQHPVANASVTALTGDPSGWRLEAFADDAHLEEAGLPSTEHPGAARAQA